MEQPPVRLYAAGIVAASLVVFTGTLSFDLAGKDRQPVAEAAPAREQTMAPRQSNAGGARPSHEPVAPAPAPTKTAATAKPPTAVHIVQSGETLSQIARLYRAEVVAIRAASGLKSDQIRAGQSLTIPGVQPLRRHVVKQGDTVWELTSRYGVDFLELIEANGDINPGHLQIGQELIIPPQSAAATVTAGMAGHQAEPSLGGVFVWPASAPVSSVFGPRWGRNHNGIDLAANTGDPIKAARDGEVLISGTIRGYGNTVILQHADSTRTLYAHASKLLVKSGQKVKQGQTIALVGSTGNSTGPHLHFEIIVNNKQRDPLLYLPTR